MQNSNFEPTTTALQPPIQWGHFAIIMATVVLLLGMTWMKQPQLFSFHKNTSAADAADAPHYYAYVTPPEDQPQPAVLGASTNQGPEIIGDDGTVHPVSMGDVLAASTDGVQLSTDSVKVNTVPDSDAAITKYFSDAQAIETSPVDNAAFESALTSGDQAQIDQQAQRLNGISDALQKLSVPQSLVKLQQLKIIQYESAVGLLQNFTQADSNPTLVDQYLQQFITSQQDLDNENTNIAQKYGSLDPNAGAYIDSNGQPYPAQDFSSLGSSSGNTQQDFNNLDSGDGGQ